MVRSAITDGPKLLGCVESRTPMACYEREPGQPSLTLVAPRDLRRWIGTMPDGRPRIRVLFSLRDAEYRLPLADPACEARLAHLGPGTYTCEDAGAEPDEHYLMTVSRGEPFGDQLLCYKIAAAVIAIPHVWTAALPQCG
jgi:hypothetical protein